MTGKEQRESCEICQFHKVIDCGGNFKFMGCRYGEYKDHPVWGDFRCPLGESRPIREKDKSVFYIDD